MFRHLFIRFGEFKNGQPSDHASIWLVLEEFSKGETGESESACCSDERENIKACFEVRIMNDKGKIEQVLSKIFKFQTQIVIQIINAVLILNVLLS